MTSNHPILVFSGSARTGSFNKGLARLAADSIRRQGGDATFVDLRDYPIPLYDGDLEKESGIPENARALKKLLAAHQGLAIASPEYNGFITPLLKNTLDWLSRPDGDEDGLGLFRDKVAIVLSASPGGFGGIRSLGLARQLLLNLGMIVLPNQVVVPRAGQAFTDSGEFADKGMGERLDTACGALVRTLARIA